MTKTTLALACLLSISLYLATGCRKDVKSDQQSTTSTAENAFRDHFHDQCRLVSNISEFGSLSYTYNRQGLVDRWNNSEVGGYFTMQYDLFGRLVKSKFFLDDGTLANTVAFFYQGDRVVKEIWFDGDTQAKVDEIFYTFNRLGKVTKGVSTLDDYESDYHYTPDGGSVDGWKFYVSGKLNYEQVYTYLPPHHKQPNRARPGLAYDFESVNGRFAQSDWYSTSEKDIQYDDNGLNPVVIGDQDPTKSIVKFNSHNYVTGTDYFDNITQDYVHFVFDYSNCGGHDAEMEKSNAAPIPGANQQLTIKRLIMPGSSESIRNQLKNLREAFKSSLNN